MKAASPPPPPVPPDGRVQQSTPRRGRLPMRRAVGASMVLQSSASALPQRLQQPASPRYTSARACPSAACSPPCPRRPPPPADAADANPPPRRPRARPPSGSKQVTVCAFARLVAIGRPIFPRPRNGMARHRLHGSAAPTPRRRSRGCARPRGCTAASSRRDLATHPVVLRSRALAACEPCHHVLAAAPATEHMAAAALESPGRRRASFLAGSTSSARPRAQARASLVDPLAPTHRRGHLPALGLPE